jgi:hypothetical protein
LIESGIPLCCPLWIGPDRDLDPHGRGLGLSRRPVSEPGPEPISFWCLSPTCGTARGPRALGTHAEPVWLVGADSPAVTAMKTRARSTTGSPVPGQLANTQEIPPREGTGNY